MSDKKQLLNFKVYEDGEVIGEVNVDLQNLEQIKKDMDSFFDCGDLEDDEIDIDISDKEIYIAIDECQYFWHIIK